MSDKEEKSPIARLQKKGYIGTWRPADEKYDPLYADFRDYGSLGLIVNANKDPIAIYEERGGKPGTYPIIDADFARKAKDKIGSPSWWTVINKDSAIANAQGALSLRAIKKIGGAIDVGGSDSGSEKD